jgi:hypothetical protein
MNLSAIAENIGDGKVVTDIYSGAVKCKCKKEIKFDELSLGGFENSLSCSCGYRFWSADEDAEEILVYSGYDYSTEDNFIMVKQRVYSEINWRKKKLSSKKLRQYNEYLYIDFEGHVFAYFDQDGRAIKDGGKNFFKNINIEDMKEFSNQVELYCKKNKIIPNYGDILKQLNNSYNTYEYELMLRKVLKEYYIEAFVKEGLSYLFQINFLKNVEMLEKNIYIDKKGTSCSKILAIPKKAVKYVAEHKLDEYRILELQDFFTEHSYNDFKLLICEEDSVFDINNLHKLKYLLKNGYSAYKLNKYAKEIISEEKMKVTDFVDYLADSVKMSRAGELEFKLYGKKLKERHDELSAKYKIVKDEVVNRKIFEISSNAGIKQYGEKYVALIPKSVHDFEEEAKQQRNCVLSYAEAMASSDILIVFVRNKAEMYKSYITLEIRDRVIVQAKRFANQSVSHEDKEYLRGLAKENKWHYLSLD